MKFGLPAAWLAFLVVAGTAAAAQSAPQPKSNASYLGFDRNDYPGDDALPALRKTFRYTSYWLNNPPGETSNSWAGKRAILRQQGFGFLVLFTGRTDAEIKTAMADGQSAEKLGVQDGKAAAAAAAREGFPKNVLIFLDQEEGGRLLPEQAAYLFGWVDAVRGAGTRAGVYCSGIEVPDGSGTISTAQDIAERETARVQAQNSSKGKTAEPLALWVANDQCPPSPGCAYTALLLALGVPQSLRRFVTVWQYAQSPRRAQFSAGCLANQAPDGNCYAPGLPAEARIFVDLNTANSPDPSESSY
jgi:hypothetical protein